MKSSLLKTDQICLIFCKMLVSWLFTVACSPDGRMDCHIFQATETNVVCSCREIRKSKRAEGGNEHEDPVEAALSNCSKFQSCNEDTNFTLHAGYSHISPKDATKGSWHQNTHVSSKTCQLEKRYKSLLSAPPVV